MEKRIYLRKLEKEDLDNIHTLYSNENTAKYMRHGVHQSIEQTKQLMAHYFENNNVAYVIQHCKSDDFVGYLSFVEEEQTGKYSLSIMCLEKYWNGGYSTEALLAGLKMIQDSSYIREILSYILETNVGSCRVMEKCGFKLYDKLDIGTNEWLYVYQYRIDE